MPSKPIFPKVENTFIRAGDVSDQEVMLANGQR